MRFTKFTFSILISALIVISCKKDPVLKSSSNFNPTLVGIDVPFNFPKIETNLNNPLSKEGIELGRMLYYDTLLSKNGPLNGLACANCHLQNLAFTNNSNDPSIIAHQNMAWRTNFLWNGSVEGTLEDAMEFEVRDFFQTDVTVLQNHHAYPKLFELAFGSNIITSQNAAKALAQFLRTVITSNSKYDKYLRREIPLTYSERNGLTIFQSEKGDCFHCHTLPLFQDNSFHNIGLDSVFDSKNGGRFNFSNDSNDIGAFMTPSLRNIEVTAPYMHDGRFQSLEEVINHYNKGVQLTDYLDPIMTKNNDEGGLSLSKGEIKDLINFLKTLTDTSFLNNPKYGNPF